MVFSKVFRFLGQKTKKTLVFFCFFVNKPKNIKVFCFFCNPPPCAGLAKLPGIGKIMDFCFFGSQLVKKTLQFFGFPVAEALSLVSLASRASLASLAHVASLAPLGVDQAFLWPFMAFIRPLKNL